MFEEFVKCQMEPTVLSDASSPGQKWNPRTELVCLAGRDSLIALLLGMAADVEGKKTGAIGAKWRQEDGVLSTETSRHSESL